MRRREFIALFGSTAATLQLAIVRPAATQQPVKVPRVGILTPAENDATPIFDAFRKGLLDLGYIEGQTIMPPRLSASSSQPPSCSAPTR
jgi:hypothetical protein